MWFAIQFGTVCSLTFPAVDSFGFSPFIVFTSLQGLRPQPEENIANIVDSNATVDELDPINTHVGNWDNRSAEVIPATPRGCCELFASRPIWSWRCFVCALVSWCCCSFAFVLVLWALVHGPLEQSPPHANQESTSNCFIVLRGSSCSVWLRRLSWLCVGSLLPLWVPVEWFLQ